MADLKSLAKAGKGGVYLILPDTNTSARYTEFDAPYFKKAMHLAGVPSSDYGVQNAQAVGRNLQSPTRRPTSPRARRCC